VCSCAYPVGPVGLHEIVPPPSENSADYGRGIHSTGTRQRLPAERVPWGVFEGQACARGVARKREHTCFELGREHVNRHGTQRTTAACRVKKHFAPVSANNLDYR